MKQLRFMFPHSFGSCLGFGEFRSFSVVFGAFRIPYEKNTKGETELTEGTELGALADGQRRRNEEALQSANRWKMLIKLKI